jgi:hypothetical protein
VGVGALAASPDFPVGVSLSSQYGSGRSLFDPAVRIAIEGGTTISTNPGAREWGKRHRWQDPKQSPVASPDAEFAWPILQTGSGALLRAPKGSRWHTVTAEQFRRHAEKFGPECVKETAAAMGVDLSPSTIKSMKEDKPYKRRRSSAELKAEVVDLHKRGLVAGAIANQLNVADRRVKEILAQAVAA